MRVLVVYQIGNTPSDTAIVCIEERLGHGATAPHPLASHCFLVIVLDDGAMVGFEAVPPAFRTFAPDEKRGAALRAYEVPCTRAQALHILDAATAMVGRPYAFDAVIGALLSMVEGRPETFFGDPAKRVDCVESTAVLLRGAGVPYCGTTPAYDLTPSQGEISAIQSKWPRVINWLPPVTPPAVA